MPIDSPVLPTLRTRKYRAVRIGKLGNCVVLRIPIWWLRELDLAPGDMIKVIESNTGGITMVPAELDPVARHHARRAHFARLARRVKRQQAKDETQAEIAKESHDGNNDGQEEGE